MNNKPESLLPSVAEIISKHTECPIDEVIKSNNTYPVNKLFECVKEAMQIGIYTALEMSSEQVFGVIPKERILSLKKDSKLKVH